MQVKNLFKVLITTVVLSSCGGEANKDPNRELVPDPEALAKDKVIPVNQETAENAALKGYYVGDFYAEKMDDKKSPMYSNKINISVDSLRNEMIYGHSVVAGNSRPFSGKFTRNDSVVHAEVSEPGDDKYDGKFSFDIYFKEARLIGEWISNDKKLAVTERSYGLYKKEFKYDPQLEIAKEHVTVFNTESEWEAEAITVDAGKFNASTQALKSSDVENLYKRDLEVMRNAIYARHGYSFKNRQMRYFFDKVSWYIPVSIDVTKELTELEQKNIALLKRYEKHAEAYYDSYGR